MAWLWLMDVGCFSKRGGGKYFGRGRVFEVVGDEAVVGLAG